MKTLYSISLKRLTLLALAAGIIIYGGIALAQQMGGPGDRAQRRVDRIAQELQLTDTQKTQITDILRQKNFRDAQDDIMKVLTPEQAEKYSKMREQQGQRGGNRDNRSYGRGNRPDAPGEGRDDDRPGLGFTPGAACPCGMCPMMGGMQGPGGMPGMVGGMTAEAPEMAIIKQLELNNEQIKMLSDIRDQSRQAIENIAKTNLEHAKSVLTAEQKEKLDNILKVHPGLDDRFMIYFGATPKDMPMGMGAGMGMMMGRGMFGMGMHGAGMPHMMKALNLSEEQQRQIQEICSNPEVTPDQCHEAIKGVLNDEQKAKFDQMMAHMQGGMMDVNYRPHDKRKPSVPTQHR